MGKNSLPGDIRLSEQTPPENRRPEIDGLVNNKSCCIFVITKSNNSPMVKQKNFESLEKLNQFLTENKVNIINVETYEYEYDTGFHLMNGTSFCTKREGKKLYYI